MSSQSPDWLTNDPQAAAALKKIDADYAAARKRAMDLPLARKIEIFAGAKRERAAARAAFWAQYAHSKP